MFGTVSSDWKDILAPYRTLFVLKTGNGDEIDWLNKVVLDHELKINIIDIGRLTQFFLPKIKEHSFRSLYSRFLKKPYRSNKNIMSDTLHLGEKLLREIMYLFSKGDSSLNTHLVDLMAQVKDIPSLNALYQVVLEARDSEWLANDLLAQPNKPNEKIHASALNGEQLLSHLIPVDIYIAPEIEEDEDTVEVNPDIIKSFFDSDFIKEKLPSYERRKSQVDYAVEVTKTLNEPIHNYVEAPTGIGKSLGYLIPAGFFLEKNPTQKIIIATCTKNLQNQVIDRDWPFINARFPELKIALLKGKSNYICYSALARQFSHSFSLDSTPEERAAWIYLSLFCDQTSGDIENIPYHLKKWITPINELLKDVQASLHCTKKLCIPHACTYGKHLQLAEDAHIIVTNHFKCALMSEGLLGKTRAIIVDEAEKFGDNVRQATSTQIDSYQFKQLLYKLRGSKKRKGFLQIIKNRIDKLSKKKGKKAEQANKVKNTVNGIIASTEAVELEFNQFLQDMYPENGKVPGLMFDFPALRSSKESIKDGLQPAIKSLGNIVEGLKALQSEDVPLRRSFKQRCESYRVIVDDLYGGLNDFCDGVNTPYYAHSFQGHPDRAWTLIKIPVDISEKLNESIYANVGHVFFTSATLYVDENASHFMNDFGSYQATEEIAQNRFPSVFNYKENVVCFVDSSITSYDYRNPQNMSQYRNDVNRAICSYTLASNGRTLVLFTSMEELNKSFEKVSPFFAAHDILALRQNGSSLEEIREFNHNEYSILFGVDRFWSGVDFPGSTLSQVIITKIPNPNLNDPLIAHHRRHDASFMSAKYPIYGKLKLRQGFGRLVRAMSDKGGVVLLDSRYEFNPYFYGHLGELPIPVGFSPNQEEIMRSVLGKAGLKNEFRQRRIDPFLEVQKFDFPEQVVPLELSKEQLIKLQKNEMVKIAI